MSEMTGSGSIIIVLNWRASESLTLLISSMALGRFFCFNLFSLFKSRARLLRSSSSLVFCSSYFKATFDLRTSIVGDSPYVGTCRPSGTFTSNGISTL